VFEKRKRRKAATRRLHEAVAAEWTRRGVTPRAPGGPAFREAIREAGLPPPGDPEYSRMAIDVVSAASTSLSDEDRFFVTGGSEGRDPFG
jgi:hypothetical protein